MSTISILVFFHLFVPLFHSDFHQYLQMLKDVAKLMRKWLQMLSSLKERKFTRMLTLNHESWNKITASSYPCERPWLVQVQLYLFWYRTCYKLPTSCQLLCSNISWLPQFGTLWRLHCLFITPFCSLTWLSLTIAPKLSAYCCFLILTLFLQPLMTWSQASPWRISASVGSPNEADPWCLEQSSRTRPRCLFWELG